MNAKFKKIWNVIWFILVAVWLAGAVYFHQLVKEDERIIAEHQKIRQQQEERLRRAASYESSRIEQKLNKDSSKNAVDSFKR